jgi:uncharacterized damage-inducible protein DinB
MTNTYHKQFQFELWSNNTIATALAQLQEPVERATLLFSHLINSHCMWMSRIKGEPLTVGLFDVRTLEENKLLVEKNNNDWSAYLITITEAELNRTIAFVAAWTTTQEKRSIRIEDALIHLINHSSYHRGQIIQLIKGKVENLPLSTYIMYASAVL